MTFHGIILALHNITRWVVVILAVIALARAYLGWFGRREWTSQDRTVGVLFTSMLDVQFLLGIVLILMAGFGNLGALLYEHIIPMLIAIVLAHIGTARVRRLEKDLDKHRQAAIWYSLAVLVVLIAIPWPPRRPLLPRL
jgi:hypothetical protein